MLHEHMLNRWLSLDTAQDRHIITAELDVCVETTGPRGPNVLLVKQ
jgi:hypothetical protein